MQHVAWYIAGVDIIVHDISHVFHLELFVPALLHETFLEEHFFIEELLLSRQLLE